MADTDPGFGPNGEPLVADDADLYPAGTVFSGGDNVPGVFDVYGDTPAEVSTVGAVQRGEYLPDAIEVMIGDARPYAPRIERCPDCGDMIEVGTHNHDVTFVKCAVCEQVYADDGSEHDCAGRPADRDVPEIALSGDTIAYGVNIDPPDPMPHEPTLVECDCGDMIEVGTHNHDVDYSWCPDCQSRYANDGTPHDCPAAR